MRPPVFHRRFGYDLGHLPNQWLREAEHGVTSVDQARTRSGASIGYPGWSVIYSCALAALHPQRSDHVVLETGTNHGATTIVLAQALKDACGSGTVHTFEIEEGNIDIARQNVKKAGLSDLVQFHLGDATHTVPEFVENIEQQISLAFLDGAHEAEVVKQEFDSIYEHLADHAIVFLDNTYPISEGEKGDIPRVNQAIPELLKVYGGQLVNLRFASWFTPGLAIWQKALPLDPAAWNAR